MPVYTTEIASHHIPSDNPIHQRLLKAYYVAQPHIKGNVLELGCGEGRGIEVMENLADSYTGIDKIKAVIAQLKQKYPRHQFHTGTFPPLPFENESFDTVTAFQVIEHIKKDKAFIKEIIRVLRPKGKALISTPNSKMTLSRNPWHVREYTAEELQHLCLKYTSNVEIKGIAANEKAMKYYNINKQAVQKIMRFDFLNLQHKLPAQILRIPYEILNRRNRNTLKKTNDQLTTSITHQDYFLKDKDDQNLDLFCIISK